MNKRVKYTFLGENKDVTKSKHPFNFYYEGQHIRLTSTDTQSTGSITNEKGNEKVLTLPNIFIDTEGDHRYNIFYGDKNLVFKSNSELIEQIDNGLLPGDTLIEDNVIIGHSTTRTGIILFTHSETGADAIWYIRDLINNNYDIELLYIRNLNFSINNPIQAIFNYENENIQKVYWSDNGRNQLRFINTEYNNIEGNENLIDLPSTSIDFVSEIAFSQPIISRVTRGGNHTSGKIQYTYNLYKLNSSQTKISPLSELVPLDKGDNMGGGEVNEIVGAVPNVTINNIDRSYDFIKIYAIKYTSYNQIPSINLIEEREIDSDSLTIYDDGSTISSLTLEELLFLGGDPVKPKHIVAKDSRLFSSNIKDSPFILPKELDCRAYSFQINSDTTLVYDEVFTNNNGVINTSSIPATEVRVSDNFNLSPKHSAINLDYDNTKYLPGSSVLGGEGKYIKYSPIQTVDNQLDKDPDEYQFFKDGEIYRIGIQFYNTVGQVSLPQWIADFKAPEGNLDGFYNTLYVELKPEFYNFINNYNYPDPKDKIIGYKIIRANRTLDDRTIICQGIVSGMMVNVPRSDVRSPIFTYSQRIDKAKEYYKMPNFLIRNMGTSAITYPLQGNDHLLNMQFTNNDPNDKSYTGDINYHTEIQISDNLLINGSPVPILETYRAADTFQYTAMMQLYSPEISFTNLTSHGNLKLRLKGECTNLTNKSWYQKININSKNPEGITKVDGAISNHNLGSFTPNVTNILGNNTWMLPTGLIGNGNKDDRKDSTTWLQIYRDYKEFRPSTSKNEYIIYGQPELTERGQGVTSYNGDTQYQYANTLEGFMSDGDYNKNGNNTPIVSINSWGEKCLTIVLGDEGVSHISRPTIESIYNDSDLTFNKFATPFVELVKSREDIYLGNIYGGNSYEEKKRTSYIEIGEYKDINDNSIEIHSPGDTFVTNFKFERISKTNTESYMFNISQITEIVDFRVETTVDLKNRNDISRSSWDSKFQPNYDEYHKYNRVYSQQPTLVKNTDVDFTFRRIKNFDTRIQASSLKIPNETIDSWSNTLPNEIMDLDGKYGPINNIISFKDKLYAFQDEGIAFIQINPRVQVQANDGIGIELGTGGILYDYDYLTTKSGSINKWGIVPTGIGIYYYDALNKGVGRVPDFTSKLLSDISGEHTTFNKYYNYKDIAVDNPLLNKGVVMGYDNYNNDVYITLLQRELNPNRFTAVNLNQFSLDSEVTARFERDISLTKVFNEDMNSFIDHKLYYPHMYINKGNKLLLLHPDNKELYEQFKGEYNHYFDEYHPSYVILQVNPESDYDCVFNNIHYNSELYLNDIDQPNKTLTHIQAWSEYQDSGRIPLVLGRSNNLRRKFREWQAIIPRQKNSRDRIRNPWIFLKLELENESNYKMILHDIIIHYTI